ncbi:hypothetical protein Daus18300_011400 [Diaporthe australafricana]|uniref:DUF7025 domain-containing protein n=1 Tax=Diaporthe australafricana TaxID=127596 RepID=A0ABR3W6J6_9PEZI
MEVDKRIVVVRSIHIKQALQKIVTYCPGLRLSGEFLEIVEPYCLFYHHLDGIKAYQRTFHGAPDHDGNIRDLYSDTKKPGLKPCDEVTYKHLAVLRDAIQSQNLAAVEEEEKRHEQSPALVTFGMLWLLLKPGTTVYTKVHGRLAACVIKQFNFSPQFTLRKEAVAYKVELWHLQYDGKVLGRYELDRSIRAFEGEKRLTDLEVTPAKFYDAHDNGALRKKLEDRGEKYFKFISRPRQVDYRGQSLGKMAQWCAMIWNRMLLMSLNEAGTTFQCRHLRLIAAKLYHMQMLGAALILTRSNLTTKAHG